MPAEKYWWKEAKIYELYIDKFASNILTLTARLDYFKTLGVNTLHILPHYPSPMVDGGYDVSDYRDVRPELGTLEQFKALVLAAHGKGIRIITDLVLNHTSDQHPWFIEARASKQNPKRNYYKWSDTGAEFPEAINAFHTIKPRNWIRNEATNDYYFATFYPAQPDLNWDNGAVFEEILSIMYFWAEIGVDGFRLDAVPFLKKREGTNCANLPETHDTLKRVRSALQAKYPEVILLAEAGTYSRDYFGNGDECHMVYNFELMRYMWLSLMRDDKGQMQRILEESRGIPENCEWATFLGNHDDISLYTLRDEDRYPLVHFLDPDGVYMFGGNCSVRVAEVYKGDEAKILDAFRLLYETPGAPIMYYGDEIGMRNLPPQSESMDARIHVRGPLDWDEAKRQAQDSSSLFGKVAAILHAAGQGAQTHIDQKRELQAT